MATPSRLPPQALVLGLTFLLWAIVPQPQLWGWVVAYLAAWIFLNFALPSSRALAVPLSRGWLLFLSLLVLAGPAALLWRTLPEIPWAEGTRGWRQHTADRERLAATPSIAPATLFDDHPQTFFLHAPGADRVRLLLGPGVEALEAVPRGEGLFQVGYNPRQHGVVKGERARISVRIEEDGRGAERTLERIRPLAHPRWPVGDPQTGRGCIPSEETDELFLVSRKGLVARIPVGDGPVDCAWWRGGAVVVHRYSPEIWWIEGESGAVRHRWTAPAFARKVTVAPRGRMLVVAVGGKDPALHTLQAAGEEGEASAAGWLPGPVVDLPFVPDTLAVAAGYIFVGSHRDRTLYRLKEGELAAGEGTPTLEAHYLGRPPVALAAGAVPDPSAVSGDGERLYVAVTDYRPDGEDHWGNHFLQDQILTFDPQTFEVVGRYLTQRRTEGQSRPGALDSGISPLGMSVEEGGALRVAFAGSEEVWRLEVGSKGPVGAPEVLGGYDLDLVAPYGVADLGEEGGERYWVATSPAGGALAVYRGRQMATFEGVTPKDGELAEAPAGSLQALALDLRVGERAFHETTRSGISCQSCHLQGGTDHSPHDIGQNQLLHTLTTRGLARTAPYLRDASFPRVQDLNAHLAATLYRGYERFLPQRGEMLERYVESLPREVHPGHWHPTAPGAGLWRDIDPAAPVALLEPVVQEDGGEGARLFQQAGCGLCHTFPAFTNLAQHPRGALFPQLEDPTGILDTPSLLGLYGKTHYLQDGRAYNLLAVLAEENPVDRHGATAALSEGEKGRLVAFLERL